MADKWWETLYDELLAKVLLDATDDSDIRKTADFLQRILALKPGDKVLDQCCGTGRLSLAMSKLGFDVLGVDLIESYIAQAKAKALSLESSCRFACADAYEFTSPDLVHAVFNWWTSFGYSETVEENIKMINRAYDSLLPGGSFALDFMNVPGLYRHFQPQVVTRIDEADGQLVLIRESRIDHSTAMLHKAWSYFLPGGGSVQHQSQVCLYSPHELSAMFSQSGFTQIQIYGDIDQSELTLNSPRCILIGRKPL